MFLVLFCGSYTAICVITTNIHVHVLVLVHTCILDVYTTYILKAKINWHCHDVAQEDFISSRLHLGLQFSEDNY